MSDNKLEKIAKTYGKFYDLNQSQIADTSLPDDMCYCIVCDKTLKRTSLKRHLKTKIHKINYDEFMMNYEKDTYVFNHDVEKALESDLYVIGRKIQITECKATGKIFSNLIPDSIHEICEPIKGYKNNSKGFWVLGSNGEPVRILMNEFKFI